MLADITPSCQNSAGRCGLTRTGESLTSDEVIERVRIAEEETKKRKMKGQEKTN